MILVGKSSRDLLHFDPVLLSSSGPGGWALDVRGFVGRGIWAPSSCSPATPLAMESGGSDIARHSESKPDGPNRRYGGNRLAIRALHNLVVPRYHRHVDASAPGSSNVDKPVPGTIRTRLAADHDHYSRHPDQCAGGARAIHENR